MTRDDTTTVVLRDFNPLTFFLYRSMYCLLFFFLDYCRVDPHGHHPNGLRANQQLVHHAGRHFCYVLFYFILCYCTIVGNISRAFSYDLIDQQGHRQGHRHVLQHVHPHDDPPKGNIIRLHYYSCTTRRLKSSHFLILSIPVYCLLLFLLDYYRIDPLGIPPNGPRANQPSVRPIARRDNPRYVLFEERTRLLQFPLRFLCSLLLLFFYMP